MEDEKKRGWWALIGVIAGSVVLLIGGYVGAYYATVKPEIAFVTSGHGSMIPYPAPSYPAIPWARPLFEPMHRIDYRLRPEFWRMRFREVTNDEEDEEGEEGEPVDPAAPSGTPP